MPGIASALKDVEIKKVDDFKIKFITKADNFNIPLLLEQIAIYNTDKKLDSAKEIDFTGMYKIVDHKKRQKIVLKRNEDYYGKKPAIENVIYEEINDNDARLTAALSNRGDIVSAIPVTGAKKVQANKNYNLVISNPSGTLEVYLNHEREALKDVKVRQALSWALNRKELVDLTTEGYGVTSSTWLESNPLFKDKKKNQFYTEYNLEKAKKLLDEAGWVMKDGVREKNGKKLTFKLFTWGAEKTLGEAIQNQWTKLGVKVEANHVDWSVIEESWKTGDWDGFIASWNHYGDMVSIISNHFSEKGQHNYSKYKSEEFNKKLEALKKEGDKEKQKELIWDINLQLAKDAVRIPIMPRVTIIAVKKNLEGFEKHFMAHPNVITNKLHFK